MISYHNDTDAFCQSSTIPYRFEETEFDKKTGIKYFIQDSVSVRIKPCGLLKILSLWWGVLS